MAGEIEMEEELKEFEVIITTGCKRTYLVQARDIEEAEEIAQFGGNAPDYEEWLDDDIESEEV